ncbi:ligase-associated DNA damage response endonuclease PdeM [uncultured Azohydromonas sp.]|jgi:Predicted ICC-like phosphoesterases|uniref:ligase-associated DNA damage response endonuclease PdeM n=1 Tax=uncultured Azohydromonas sp. TaxID=487342 RepID=UPI0026115B1E|nr:ligase-associated DNA damage response endonuclease PdeM [uncultured Azohydromonas sp.]
MNGGETWIERGGERLQLLAERALWWPARQALLVADAHFGKAASFRRLGVPVPQGTTGRNLDVLSGLIERHGARRLLVLGDLLHSAHAHDAPDTLAALAAWRAARVDLRIVLVRGNHDDRAGDPPAALGIEVVDEPLRLAGLALCHHPRALPGAYVLAGHLHPCITIGRGFDRLRLPCFHFGPAVGVLPAFGAFTGMHPVRPGRADEVYVVAGEVVRRV